MPRVVVFNQITLDGYFSDANGDMSWAHKSDPEWNNFGASNASKDGLLLFGRITYELMARFWPTAVAAKTAPVMAEHMNARPKIVFSRTMHRADWNNTRVASDACAEVQKLKDDTGPDMVILGSGRIVSQLAAKDLIDEYQFVVNPLVLGKGRTMFEGLEQRKMFKQTNLRTFKNGNVVLYYARA